MLKKKRKVREQKLHVLLPSEDILPSLPWSPQEAGEAPLVAPGRELA